MSVSALNCAPKSALKSATLIFDGRKYSLTFEAGAYRLRCRSKTRPVDYRTGQHNLSDAKRVAREWLERHANSPVHSRKGGGTLEAVVALYKTLPKRAADRSALINISRLRGICRVALGKELKDVTCREVHHELWEKYQRAALAKHGRAFNYSTRYRENVPINSALNAARSLFTRPLIAKYRNAGLDVREDAALCTRLPQPYVVPTKVDDAELCRLIAALPRDALWLTLSIARYGGLRCEEIAAMRGKWIEEKNGMAAIWLCDRPEDGWWTKTGKKPYHALIIEAELSEHLLKNRDADYVVDPGGDRHLFFKREPQSWLKRHGVTARKPLHRLRGLYADHLARLTENAITARLAGVEAARKALGHTDSKMTEKHYLSQ